jgi:uncharacterized membrane-anchored protein
MGNEVKIGEAEQGPLLEPHPLRGVVLGELHARPSALIETPTRVLHFGFITDAEKSATDRTAFSAFCASRGLPVPEAGAKQHRVALGATLVKWEQHAEFTTYSWEMPSDTLAGVNVPFHPPAGTIATPMGLVAQPGPLVVAIDLHLVADAGQGIDPLRLFDRSSLAMATVAEGAATIATDFRADPAGFVRILVVDRQLGSARAGLLVQRLLELETYRTLALLGLPEAQRLGPVVRRAELKLGDVTKAMQGVDSVETDHQLLAQLTALASEQEAGAAAAAFRFGASRAYYGIMQDRLVALDEKPVAGSPTFAGFLGRRMSPAMRTVEVTAERQRDLSGKLTRAADLLRTRVDVALAAQNRDLLSSMNDRTRLQLRLQQTVEGLSIAAITYYVVGLFGYLAKGIEHLWHGFDPTLATGLFVPVALIGIYFVLQRIKGSHTDSTR